MAPAVATLSDDRVPCWGMAASASHRLRVRAASPSPRSRAPGPPAGRPGAGRRASGRASPTRPTVHDPEAGQLLEGGRAPRPPGPWAGTRWPRPPPWPRSGDRWAERCRGSTTPVTPAHSALRRSAPRLCGSVIPSSTSRNGSRPRLVGWHRSSSGGLLDRPGQRHHPLGAVGAGHGVDAACGTRSSTLTRRLAARASMSSRMAAASIPSAISSVRHRAPVGAQQLADGLAALDLVAPEPAVLGPRRDRRRHGRRRPAAPVAARRRPPPLDRRTRRPACPSRLASGRPPAGGADRGRRPAPPARAGPAGRRPPPARRRAHRAAAPGPTGRADGGQQHHGRAGDPLGPAQRAQALGPGGLHVDRGARGAAPSRSAMRPRAAPASGARPPRCSRR